MKSHQCDCLNVSSTRKIRARGQGSLQGLDPRQRTKECWRAGKIPPSRDEHTNYATWPALMRLYYIFRNIHTHARAHTHSLHPERAVISSAS